ncbi:MAG: hypothetical protein JWM52_492 [Candidatus Saccharibacteria bacterium]|nr:hypothetical protein [Candidatus Saccharibacteria bacterium]
MLPVNRKAFSDTAPNRQIAVLDGIRLERIERSTVLTLSEKINLVRLLMHRKWIADVGVGRDLMALREELHALDIPFRTGRYSPGDSTEWLQAGVNVAVLNYVADREAELSELEAGVLYGYPTSHSLGFSGVLESTARRPDSAALFYLAGIYSKEFARAEVDFFLREWSEFSRISPLLATEAESAFSEFKKERSSYQPY